MATCQPSWQKLFAKSGSDRKYLTEITLFFVDFSTLKYWKEKVSYSFCMGYFLSTDTICHSFLSVDTMCYFMSANITFHSILSLSRNIFCLHILFCLHAFVRKYVMSLKTIYYSFCAGFPENIFCLQIKYIILSGYPISYCQFFVCWYNKLFFLSEIQYYSVCTGFELKDIPRYALKGQFKKCFVRLDKLTEKFSIQELEIMNTRILINKFWMRRSYSTLTLRWCFMHSVKHSCESILESVFNLVKNHVFWQKILSLKNRLTES